MKKLKGQKEVSAAAVYNLMDYKNKGIQKNTNKLTEKEMCESMDFRKRNRDKN